MLALSSTFFCTAEANAPSQSVYLTVISRCGNSIILAKAEISALDGHPVADIPLKRAGPYFYTGQTIADPGTYRVGLSEEKCWGDAKITVLPGHDRYVGIEVTPLGMGHHDAYAFLYGTLPFAGFVRGTLVGKHFEDPVDIDRDAYYVEHAYPGSYVLTLFYVDSLQCRLPITIPEHGMRLDIGVEQMQQCIGFPYHHPSTGESGFVPLFPSPSPSP